MRAYIIVDLGFGDAGKGLLTDFLVRYLEAGVVVRYNGGAQAGHNVVTSDGRHHTFSQFGSGTFVPHVKTYLSKDVVIHPDALLVEGDILEKKGIRDPFSRLRLSDQALVITPFHQATNRIREVVRGAGRHGSCGVGVGEAVEDAILYPENRILAGDLNNSVLLRRKLQNIHDQKREQVIALYKEHSIKAPFTREYEIFEQRDVVERWITSIARISELGLVVSDGVLENWLHEAEHVIFEGAQGVLLDEDAGFHPYTTWSRSSAINALDLIQQVDPDSNVYRIGVMRSHAVRHGPGPLPTETDILKPVVSEHNRQNEWQGMVRYGWFDAVLARYALDTTGGVDALAITHMDALSRLNAWTYCPGYGKYVDLNQTFIDATITDGLLTKFHPPTSLSLADREQFTNALSNVVSALEICDTDEKTVIRRIERLLEQPIDMISIGPTAGDVQVLRSLPT